MAGPTPEFWQERFESGQTPWDRGVVHAQLQLWVDYAAQVHRWLRPGGSLFALFVQAQRPGAAEGMIQGPPYHCDIHGMRALFPVPRWTWPKPPYPRLSHPAGMAELAVELVRA